MPAAHNEMVSRCKRESKDDMSIVMFQDWDKYGVTAGYSTESAGRFRFCCPEDMEHYEQVAGAFGLTAEQMVRVHQKHTDRILSVHKDDAGEGVIRDTIQEAYDAMITSDSDLMLCVVTADCVPVFLYDTKRHIIGLAHSGRAGTMKEIAALTVQKMKEIYGTDPTDIQCILGPYLCKEHHEVRECDITGFTKRFTASEQSKFITCRGDRYYIDMGEAIRVSLRRIGMKEENIKDDRLCTYENSALYSWRRDHDPDARIISFLILRARLGT